MAEGCQDDCADGWGIGPGTFSGRDRHFPAGQGFWQCAGARSDARERALRAATGDCGSDCGRSGELNDDLLQMIYHGDTETQSKLLHEELTERVIGAAIEMHR